MVAATRILLIDDNEKVRHDLGVVLTFIGEGAIATTSSAWRSSIEAAAADPAAIQVAIIGETLFQPLDALLAEISKFDGGISFVLLGAAEVPPALDAGLASRVTAVLPRVPNYQPLLDALHKASLFHEHYRRLQDIEEVRDFSMFRSLVGNSAAMQRVRHMMSQVANKEVSVLITGESGTGKEVVARNLHLNSSRAEHPFVPINCGAIPRELLESELFGHEKGAFTGALAARAGRFELADGGTLFLDEIGDMPLNMQVKMLRVLQERSFERVGGVRTIQTDVRILAATHQNLEEMVAKGEFRQDLFYRLNVFPIEMPPLRERAEDVPLLLNELISAMESESRGSVRFNSAAISSLRRHPWQGNVRELANLVERMAILHPHGIVGVNDLPPEFRHLSDSELVRVDAGPQTAEGEAVIDLHGSGAGQPEQGALLPLSGLDLKEYLANLEKDLIEQALVDSEGVVARAAKRLHMRRTTLVEKMRKYRLQKKQDGDDEDEAEQAAVGPAASADERGETEPNNNTASGNAAAG